MVVAVADGADVGESEILSAGVDKILGNCSSGDVSFLGNAVL